MNFLKSIRWQVQAWHAVVLTSVVVFLLTSFYFFEKREQIRQCDDDLQKTLIMLLPILNPPLGQRPPPPPPTDSPGLDDRPAPPEEQEPSPGEDRPPNPNRLDRPRYLHALEQGPIYFIAWRNGDEQRRSANAPQDAPAPTRDGNIGDNLFRNRQDYREVSHRGPDGQVILIGTSLRTVDQFLRKLILQLAGLGSAVIAVGLLGGWWLAGRTIRPIEEIAAAAWEISEGDLARRIPAREDQSELGRLVQVLNETFARLDHSFAQQTRFTADASHELRTPVSVILAQAQLALSKEREPEEYRKALEICRRNAEGMKSLVHSLMELSRIDSQEKTAVPDADDLDALVAEICEQVRPLAEEAELPLLTDIEPLSCPIDREKMGRVLLNLLTNAIRYNRPGGSITVTTRQEGGWATVEIVDSGIGIAPEDIPHLFERFYRSEKSRSRDKGGVGLGLAICQAYVAAHHGAIRVESVPGEGSAFIVELPM